MRVSMTKVLAFSVPVALFSAIAMLIPIPPPRAKEARMQTETIAPEQLPTPDPQQPLRLLFIHHSCGGQWLASAGPDRGMAGIYETAENAGGLRERLVAAGYEVHESSYGSLVGNETDIFDWPGKFRGHMGKLLTCDHQDTFYEDARRNDIVVFKSCFPNNLFIGRGQAPGDPRGPQLTVENAKAAYRTLLPEFAKYPDTLFIAVTAPPLALETAPLYKVIARRLLGRPNVRASGGYAREFNNWLKDSRNGWLSSYAQTNVAVFDLYDILTDCGKSDFSRYPTGRRRDDSHPSAEGNRIATDAFVPILNEAVKRVRLAGPAAGRNRSR
jgi:hypothetical protein